MASFTVISDLSRVILVAVNAWNGIAASLISVVIAPIVLGSAIMLMWHGVAILRGAGGQHHALDMFAKMLRAFLVVTIALAGSAYEQNIHQFFVNMRESLSSMFVSGSGTSSSSYNQLDFAVNEVLGTWKNTYNWAIEHVGFGFVGDVDFSGVVAIVSWFLMCAAFMIFAAICALNLILIDFSLALVFSLGPIFIACFAFAATAQFTSSWIAAVLKYTFTAIVISAVIGLGIGILKQYSTALAGNPESIDFVVTTFAAIASSLILCILAARIPSIAGDIVGGIGIAAFGPSIAGGVIATAAKASKSAAGVAGNAAAFGVGAAASSSAGQAVGGSSLGRTAVGMASSVAGAARSTSSTLGGSIGNAYLAGRGTGSSGVGTATGRPAGQIHQPAKK